ncbi:MULTISPECIES: helix-turn-helix domain-containing protein [Actinomadura]|uniref:helix-turn-helix domain-containing protein n=1 Tax=Actinomadura sp. NPDC000929 TaxID=3154517 RepID=UPI00339170F3
MDFADRLRASGLSLWELGDLLGIHPHYLSGRQPDLRDHPVAVLIEICRRLDTHPADLVPTLDSVLRNRRRTPPGGTKPDAEPDAEADVHQDTQTVLTALTVAGVPLTRDVLAEALDWPLRRVQGALDHALNQPELAGPLALRRVPPDAYTLTDDEATVLLAAIGVSRWPPQIDWNELRADPRYQAAVAALKEAGVLYSDTGPHRIGVHPDVLFSLRYEDDTRLARQLGEDLPPVPQRDPWSGSVRINRDGTVAGPEH